MVDQVCKRSGETSLVATSSASRWRSASKFFKNHIDAAERLAAGCPEGRLLSLIMLFFTTLWVLYLVVSSAPLDADSDVSDVSLWVHNLGFGYHHPPLQVWIFGLWFSVFPRSAWAVKLLASCLAASALAITWRMAPDVLDRERALIGVTGLMLVPFYTFVALTLDANTVAMPFWAAAQLFYLRALRAGRISDSALAGTCAALALLGKFWAIYLVVGMGAASFQVASVRRFWLSSAPYVMAVSAIVVVALWLAVAQGGAALTFAGEVRNGDSFGSALVNSVGYLADALGYVSVPILIVASLRPSREALADMIWPADEYRRQALVLLAVPLILPALVNLVFPHRLTSLWTMPNWALLPVVLFGSPVLTIKSQVAVRTGFLALTVALAAMIAAPVIASNNLRSPKEQNRTHYHQVAEAAERLAGGPVKLLWGSPDITGGLPFYLPGARLLNDDPQSAKSRSAISQDGLVIVCLADDAGCRAVASTLASLDDPVIDLSPTRTYLGLAGPPASYRIVAVRAKLGKTIDQAFELRLGPLTTRQGACGPLWVDTVEKRF
jgi:4-amino-4-deoxy-L-arabinose transferase-like glycosyltransferase